MMTDTKQLINGLRQDVSTDTVDKLLFVSSQEIRCSRLEEFKNHFLGFFAVEHTRGSFNGKYTSMATEHHVKEGKGQEELQT